MPDLTFRVDGAEAIPFAAEPMLALNLRVENALLNETIHSIALRAQIQIEAQRRQYKEPDKERLLDLFGEPDRWSKTLRPILWTHASTVIPSFTGVISVALHLPCSFDFNSRPESIFTECPMATFH